MMSRWMGRATVVVVAVIFVGGIVTIADAVASFVAGDAAPIATLILVLQALDPQTGLI